MASHNKFVRLIAVVRDWTGIVVVSIKCEEEGGLSLVLSLKIILNVEQGCSIWYEMACMTVSSLDIASGYAECNRNLHGREGLQIWICA